MTIDGATIPEFLVATFRDPRAAARRLIGLQLDSGMLWQAFLLVAVLSVMTNLVFQMLLGTVDAPPDPRLPALLQDPILLGYIQACLLVLAIFAVHWVGRLCGGTGPFEGAIIIVTWLQFVLLVLSFAQVIAAFALPPLVEIIALVGPILGFWLLSQFVCALHGFESGWTVFVGTIVAMFGLVFALAIGLTLISVLFGLEIGNV